MQRDYILRLIEQSGAVLRALLARVLGGAVGMEEVRHELQHAGKLGGLDADQLLLFDVETIKYIIGPNHQEDPSKAWLAAEMLYVHAVAAETAEETEVARAAFSKARALFSLLAPTWIVPGFAEAADRVADIDHRLGRLS